MKEKPGCFICETTRNVKIHFIDWNMLHDTPSNKIFACKKCIDVLAQKDIIDIFGVKSLRKNLNFKKKKPVQMELFK